MDTIRELGNVDIYLIDQLLQGAISTDHVLLDAGCGSGRNFSYFAKNNFNIIGIDPMEEHIARIKEAFPNYADKLQESTIEAYQLKSKFDFIICNAVLHFAESHEHFHEMFEKLVSLLVPGGTLFIRMTTLQGMPDLPYSKSGVYELPDGSQRYLITRNQVTELCKRHSLSYAAPFKTVLIENLRSMAIIVLKRTVTID